MTLFSLALGGKITILAVLIRRRRPISGIMREDHIAFPLKLMPKLLLIYLSMHKILFLNIFRVKTVFNPGSSGQVCFHILFADGILVQKDGYRVLLHLLAPAARTPDTLTTALRASSDHRLSFFRHE